jgi:hypothetical protein
MLLLASTAIISIALEGGLAFFPGLSNPRQINLATYSEVERNNIQSIINSVVPVAKNSVGRGDQRFYRIVINAGTSNQTLLIPEQDATEDLKKLWEQAKPE